MPVEAVDTLRALLRIPSPSGNEDAIAGFIHDTLRDNGLPARIRNGNVVLRAGHPRVTLASHMDTVPGGPDPRETRTHLYGRGACDAKASIAAMMTAAIHHEGRDFGLAFTVQEETNFAGAEDLGTMPFAVVGEPTSLRLINGTFGNLTARIRATGHAAHASRDGVNAIDMLYQTIDVIRQSLPDESTLQTTRFSAGSANNVIPGSAEATVDIRYPPGPMPGLGRYPNIRIEKLQTARPALHPVPAELAHLGRPRQARFVTELSVYRRGFILGPGDIEHAHTDAERVAKREVRQAATIYGDILARAGKSFS